MKTTSNIQHSTSNPQRSGLAAHSLSGVECSALKISARRAERGIALVITLILLSVTLIMAVAFLALSRRERSAVATTTDAAAARLAADSALAAAQAQIAANIFATTNLGNYNFSLLVSTNYQNSYGFVPGVASPTNVNYDYRAGGGALNASDLIENVANLWLLPRAPVFVNTNAGFPLDFRYYLDLNRNGWHEGNGWQPQFGNSRFYLHPDGTEDNLLANVVTNFMVGDPEWIGVLEKPEQPHGPNNPFVARYAFLAQPIGNGLDLNFIHNQTFNSGLGVSDGFFRNEGVGSWELNLAAFLSDLNTNQWNPPTVVNSLVNNPYNYQQPFGFQNTGVAFEDARALLSWRYAFNYNSLAIPPNYFYNGLVNAGIDGYTVGNLMTTPSLPLVSFPTTRSWAGSDNPNRYFAIASDLFDPAKVPAAFSSRLLNVGTNNSSYDRYTFYRMLDQLGTDSSADADKMNLNYDNLDTAGNVVPGAETNMIAWTPDRFFTNAANRMLRYYTAIWATPPTNTLSVNRDFTNTYGTVTTSAFGVGNIPVYVEGRFVYTPAVNRLLQLAANLYDASTNKASVLGKDFPSVFRPVFKKVTTNGYNNIYIVGFHEITRATPPNAPLDEPLEITDTALNTTGNANDTTANANAYGVPWIIGAKKGFPNFNQFMSMSTVRVTRKLQLQRADGTKAGGTSGNATWTNQMFLMSITNRFGVAFWNSYSNNYVPQGSLIAHAHNRFDLSLTNDLGVKYNAFSQYFYYNPTLSSQGVWPGSAWSSGKPEQSAPSADSFLWSTNDYSFLPESQFDPYSSTPAYPFLPISNTKWYRSSPSVPVFPQFGLLSTNRLQAYIVDGGRVIDYVHFTSSSARDIDQDIADTSARDSERKAMANRTSMWDTNTPAGAAFPARGVENQIYVSRYNPNGDTYWPNPANMPPGANTAKLESDFFNAFFVDPFTLGSGVNTSKGHFENTNVFQQAPYTPTRTAWDLDLWQANDPLVHHLASDLVTINQDTIPDRADKDTDLPPPTEMNTLTAHFQPWGRGAQMGYFDDVIKDKYDSRIRDPLVWRPDLWDFPTNKYPSVGWLGRVHRGTPWQTIYLKSRNILADTTTVPSGALVGTNTWAKWTGNNARSFGANNYWDAANTAPVRDGMLFDLFTARFNENAAHGTLSVNVGAGTGDGGLAAWSAVLSGVVALTNTTSLPISSTVPAYTNLIVSPAGLAGIYSPVGMIVTNINALRSGYVTAGGLTGAFTSAGDILRVPTLSDHSPFLNWNNADQQKYGISDRLYEWLPQQIMGLLRLSGSPRYVIYCYGQALRPAPGSQVLSATIPNTFGMVTNYQVVAESAARAVIRFDKKVTATGTNYTSTVESYNPLPPD